MEFGGIIRSEKDRVFMVDPECFIIFTGTESDDPQPFIRIGNWTDLPAELIPLIENIIIPDRLIGNPSNEQFNIDVEYLPTNRYIGSRGLVKRYLDYQKIFCLDLKNAEIVDAEKDIPEIKTRSGNADRDSFIGIFYNDGNFKINHNKNVLFDLTEAFKNSFTDIAMNEKLSLHSRKIEGTGFFITEDNPVFFSGNNLVSYLFPSAHYSIFSKLGINPRYISAVIHPTVNYLHISKFLKWKNYSRSRIKLYCDYAEDTDCIKKLFSDAQIQTEKFTGFKYQSPGFEISEIKGTYNVDIKTETDRKTLRYAFVKSETGFRDIIKKKFDMIFISYSVFEEKSASLRASGIPFAVIDDGSPSFEKLLKGELNALNRNSQYIISRSTKDDLSKNIACLLGETALDCGEELVALCASKLSSDGMACYDWFNITAALRFIIEFSRSRKTVSSAKNLLRDTLSSSASARFRKADGMIFNIHLTEGSIFITAEGSVFMETTTVHDSITRDLDLSEGFSNEEKRTVQKILADRERLAKLLSVLKTNESHSEYVRSLENAILKRREIFSEKIVSKNGILNASNQGACVSFLSKIPLIGKIAAGSRSIDPYEYTYEDFSSKSEIDDLCRRIRKDAYATAGFRLPQMKSGLDFLNAILRSTSFFFAWKALGKDKETPNAGEIIKASKKIGNFSGSEFNSLTTENTKALAAFNRKIIDATYLFKNPADTKKPKRVKLTKTIIAAAALILITAAILFVNARLSDDSATKPQNSVSDNIARRITADERDKIERDLEKILPVKHDLAGWDYEVFVMANRIAITNNYSPILESHFGKKNPNWIYPENTFILPDGGKITVRKGDTLWKIAGEFLQKAHDEFTRAYSEASEKIKKGSKPDRRIIEDAEYWAFTSADRNLLKAITGK